MVEGWKGPVKSLGIGAIGIAAVGAALMSIFGRPNRVSEEDQAEAGSLVSALRKSGGEVAGDERQG